MYIGKTFKVLNLCVNRIHKYMIYFRNKKCFRISIYIILVVGLLLVTRFLRCLYSEIFLLMETTKYISPYFLLIMGIYG